jgi:hypothetical protein
MNFKVLLLISSFSLYGLFVKGQTTNTSPLPAGETVIGGHLHALGDEVWTDQPLLYFNYRGNAATTYFWNKNGNAGTAVMTLLNTGKVGINHMSPLYPLHVTGTIATTSMFVNDVSNSAQIRLNSNGTYFGKIGNPSAQVWSLGYGGSGTDINPVLSWTISGVGINRTDPVYPLHVNGNIGTTGMLVADTYNAAQIRLNSSGSFYGKIGSPTPQIWSLGYGNAGTDITQVINWNSSGIVGIGTANLPSSAYKLLVNGKIKAEEVNVLVDVADYVFEPHYDLRSLEEVEAYIKENKHLPGVPGKAEVDVTGFEVGFMTNKVLEKVEELTLYIIELKKENKELKERLDAIEKK